MRSLLIGFGLCCLGAQVFAQTVSPTQLDFGRLVVGDSRTLITRLTNTTGGPVQILSFGVANTVDFNGTGPSLITLEKDSSVIYTVTFSPPATNLPTRLHVGTLTINLQGFADITVPLQGYDHDQDTATVSIARNYWQFADSDLIVSQRFVTPIKDFADSIRRFDERITFDKNVVELNQVKPGERTPVTDWTILNNQTSKGEVTIHATAFSAALKDSGEILRLRFHILSKRKAWDFSEIVQDNMSFGSVLEPIMLSTPGLIRVKDACDPVFVNSNATASNIEQLGPNPSSGISRLKYVVRPPEGALESHVTIRLYDATGRAIATLVDWAETTGTYEIPIEGTLLANGLYTCEFLAGSYRELRHFSVVH
jgi:hypothetical protein